MAFYFSSETMAFYDSDVFPAASLPENKVEITEAVYTELMTKQNQGYVIKADNSGNPYAVAQGEAPATDINHAASVATTIALGHVKIGNTMQAANDGTLDLKDGAVTTAKIVDANVTADKLASNSVTAEKITDANVTADKLASNAVTTPKIADQNVTTAKIADNGVTTAKIADQNVTTDKLADGSVTEAKLDSVKELAADETTLTMDEDANGFTFSVKDGGIGTQQLAANAVTTAKIADQAITQTQLADYAVISSKIPNYCVLRRHINPDAVGPDEVDQTGEYKMKSAYAQGTHSSAGFQLDNNDETFIFASQSGGVITKITATRTEGAGTAKYDLFVLGSSSMVQQSSDLSLDSSPYTTMEQGTVLCIYNETANGLNVGSGNHSWKVAGHSFGLFVKIYSNEWRGSACTNLT